MANSSDDLSSSPITALSAKTGKVLGPEASIKVTVPIGNSAGVGLGVGVNVAVGVAPPPSRQPIVFSTHPSIRNETSRISNLSKANS